MTTPSDASVLVRLFTLYPGSPSTALEAKWPKRGGKQRWLYKYFESSENTANWGAHVKENLGYIGNSVESYQPFKTYPSKAGKTGILPGDVTTFMSAARTLIEEASANTADAPLHGQSAEEDVFDSFTNEQSVYGTESDQV